MEKEEDEEVEEVSSAWQLYLPRILLHSLQFCSSALQKTVEEFQENQRLNNHLIIIIIIVIIIRLIVIFKIARIGRLRCCQQRCKKYDFARFCTESGLRAVLCNPLEKI